MASGRRQQSNPASGQSHRGSDGLRVVGDVGGPQGLPLWRGLSQGDGVEPQRAEQRQTQRQAEDYQAWSIGRPEVAVLRRHAGDPRSGREAMVRSQEGQGRRSWQGRADRCDSQIGVGPLRGGRSRRAVPAVAAVSRKIAGPQITSETTRGRLMWRPQRFRRGSGDGFDRGASPPNPPGFIALVPIPETGKGAGRRVPPRLRSRPLGRRSGRFPPLPYPPPSPNRV